MNIVKPRKIPVAAPALVGREKEYVMDCMDTNWISSNGKYIHQFEQAFATYTGVPHAISCCNGTVAIHLALLAFDLKPGDEVIIPTLTYVASANPVVYCGATPVFVDVDPTTWCIDPAKITAKITPRTKGIIAVHLYGHPADMDPILKIAAEQNLFVIEDVAEAHGASYKGRMAGTMGDIATFSFFGNKIITTGEGGMMITRNSELARKMRLFKGQGMDPNRRFWFPITGYNYRMTNIEAAIGLAQLEKIEWHISSRKEIAAVYSRQLSGCRELDLPPNCDWATNVFWLYSVVLTEHCALTRDEVMAKLAAAGIETRPFFYPMHILPMFADLAKGQTFPVADHLSSRGINLPTFANLADEDLAYVIAQLLKIVRS
ncbi:MAG: DegT/DnrJ/EryC1/StrS family aminotransferase [bacterium]